MTKLLNLVRAIISGEHPEAMQTGTAGCQYSWLTIFSLVIFVFFHGHQQNVMNFPNNSISVTSTESKPNKNKAHMNRSIKNATNQNTITIAKSCACISVINDEPYDAAARIPFKLDSGYEQLNKCYCHR